MKRYRLLIRFYSGDKIQTFYRIGPLNELLELTEELLKTSTVSVDLEDITYQAAIGG